MAALVSSVAYMQPPWPAVSMTPSTDPSLGNTNTTQPSLSDLSSSSMPWLMTDVHNANASMDAYQSCLSEYFDGGASVLAEQQSRLSTSQQLPQLVYHPPRQIMCTLTVCLSPKTTHLSEHVAAMAQLTQCISSLSTSPNDACMHLSLHGTSKQVERALQYLNIWTSA